MGWGRNQKRDVYGYDYVVPLGAPFTAPIAIISVIGFILSAYSVIRTQRIRMLNVVAGLLILVGIAASFGYTTSVAFADVSQKGGSFHAWGDYGMGLEALLGFLMILGGASPKRARAKTSNARMHACNATTKQRNFSKT